MYRSLIESILAFNIIAWYGNLTVKDRARLSRVVNLAGKVIGIKQNSLSDIYYQSVRRKACKITQDPTHPLFESFTMLPSGRRLRVPLAKKNCYKHSFIPTAIQILNSRWTWTGTGHLLWSSTVIESIDSTVITVIIALCDVCVHACLFVWNVINILLLLPLVMSQVQLKKNSIVHDIS